MSIAEEIFGSRISHAEFEVRLTDSIISSKDILLHKSACEKCFVLQGKSDGISFRWVFEPLALGFKVWLEMESARQLHCHEIKSLVFKHPISDEQKNWKIPMLGNIIENTGVKEVWELTDNAVGSCATGLFEAMDKRGIMLSQIIPLNFRQRCNIKREEDTLLFSTATEYTRDYSENKIVSQPVWVCVNCTIEEGMAQIASMLPKQKSHKPRVMGWNSWDYYFTTVSHEDIVENMEAICRFPKIREKLRYIIVDDGWQYNWGEWESNHKFPNGVRHTAKSIREHGFIPGIWTAPLQVETLSYPALRESDMLVKDEFGDPFVCPDTGHYLLDPTHPRGREFLKSLYTGLYDDGFRLFKVDFIENTCAADAFYKKNVGPYEAIRQLFELIRECVTDESHIIACFTPPECGAGVADSGRTGIDIHNCWTHLQWAIDTYEWAHIYHNKIWVNDIDFLIVRGPETSSDENTNVLNPKKHYFKTYDGPLNKKDNRWRNGEDFSFHEAETWANIVSLGGGNIVLGDRISTLNDKGAALISEALSRQVDGEIRPHYLSGDTRASMWRSEKYILLINWDDKPRDISVPCELSEGFTLCSEKAFIFENGRLTAVLNPHESIVLEICKFRQNNNQ